ncbi:MAG TPA: hypothetical protein VHE30_02125 [Polyangiaceae bacterium]|nr:hypothetical protein [Polyangiaceae bacterium]
MKPLRRLACLLSLSVAALSVAACADQNEGERCDTRNGNSDCASGLVCKHITGADTYSAACCPATGTSTKAACNANGGINPDAGLTPVTVPDSGNASGGATGAGGASSGGKSADAGKDH